MVNEKYIGLKNYIDLTKIKYNEPLAKHSTMKVGGPADVLVEISTLDEIEKVVEFARENKIKYYVLGNGSNVFATDKGYRGIIIKIAKSFSDYNIDGDEITVCAGMSMPRLASIAQSQGLSGLEFACGIPGTIGGGVRMNAGAYGGEMQDVVTQTKFIDENGILRTISHDEHEFSYRHTIFTDNPKYIILETTMKLKAADKDEIKNKMMENSKKRREKQPLEYPNCGSTFKRPEGLFVGQIIQESNLKGYTVGGAQVSEKHAGFIINRNNATAKDVLDLISHIQSVIKEKYNVELKVEVIVIGEK
ncbi:MAG: UDP-N-acetylmuramate dehydrogenase [Clostridia bacterium]